MSGRYVGTAVPRVGGLSLSGYQAPANWQNPAVSGRDLMVRHGELRHVARQLTLLATALHNPLSLALSTAGAAGAAGSWPAAQALNLAMARAHHGVTRFATELLQAHNDTAIRLVRSADRYDAAEQYLTHRIQAAQDPTATIIAGGGQNRPVDPGYGQHWTQAQRLAYAQTQRLMNMPGNSGPVWTGTLPVTDGTGFPGTAAGGYTWQEVHALLAAANPAAISQAGTAYLELAQALTTVAGGLPGLGATLAGNWGGVNAVTAVSQIQQLYQTAADLQANTWAAGQALQWYGPVLASFQSTPLQPASSHPADVAAANLAAQQRMEALNGHLQTAYYQMPPTVNKNLPPPLSGSGSGSGSGTGAGGGYAGGGSPAGGGYGGVSTGQGSSGAGPVSFGAVPGTSAAPGGFSQHQAAMAQLAAAPGGAPGTLPPVTAPAPGGSVPPPGGSGGVGVLPPPAAGVPGEPVPASEFGAAPGEPVPASEFGAAPGTAMPAESAVAGEAVAPQVAGQQSLAAADGAVPAEGAVAGEGPAGPGMMPGGAAGANGEDAAGRLRQSWVTEDEATWSTEAAGLAEDPAAADPAGWSLPVGPGGGRGDERERSRLAWLAEEEDFWDPGEPAAPPVIGAPAAAR